MLGLTVTLSLLTVLHTHLPSSNYPSVCLKVAFLLAAVLESYFFLQLNFELVSHNFGSKFFFFFNNNLFFLEVLAAMMLSQLAILRTFLPLYGALRLHRVASAVLNVSTHSYLLRLVPPVIALF
tara:strand:+ start:1136 stop:1507 length:372 start_codon:yes stop_codon:yes gene_type:complete